MNDETPLQSSPLKDGASVVLLFSLTALGIALLDSCGRSHGSALADEEKPRPHLPTELRSPAVLRLPHPALPRSRASGSGDWIILKLSRDLEGKVRQVVQLLRPRSWTEKDRLRIGGRFRLLTRESSFSGTFRVDDISRYDGKFRGTAHQGARFVTGTFLTEKAQTATLTLIDGSTIRGTPNHPVLSVDRNQWVGLGELKEGERLHTRYGTTAVVEVEQHSLPEPVYNIEVEKSHQYFVSRAGVLCHNECARETPPDDDSDTYVSRGAREPAWRPQVLESIAPLTIEEVARRSDNQLPFTFWGAPQHRAANLLVATNRLVRGFDNEIQQTFAIWMRGGTPPSVERWHTEVVDHLERTERLVPRLGVDPADDATLLRARHIRGTGAGARDYLNRLRLRVEQRRLLDDQVSNGNREPGRPPPAHQ